MKRRVITAALFAVVAAASVPAQSLLDYDLPADYVSDRCSMFPDGDYGDCCVAHDKAYFFGGTKKQRREADAELYRCVKGRGHGFIAKMMWVGVRVGGVGFLPTSFRWGFGKDWKAKGSERPSLPK